MHDDDDDGVPNATKDCYLVFLFCVESHRRLSLEYTSMSLSHVLRVSQPFCASCCWPHLLFELCTDCMSSVDRVLLHYKTELYACIINYTIII
jgi:hypothetical protein